jgi:vancomycin resistance protein YoaR
MDGEMRTNQRKVEFIQLILAVPVSLVVFLGLAFLLLLGFSAVYANRIYPGVYVNEMDLSGMTLEEASLELDEDYPFADGGSLRLTYQEEAWEVQPIELGYVVDPTISAQQALDVGRRSWFLPDLIEAGQAWFGGVQLSPVAYYDERIAQGYLQTIAAEIDQPVIEASLALEDAEVIVKNGQIGFELDIPTTLEVLEVFMSQMQSGEIPLVVLETPPDILDASIQAEMATEILSEPLVLTDEDDGEDILMIQPKDLAEMLNVTRVENGGDESAAYQISLNETLFNLYLSSLAPELSMEPVNTRFMFNDDTLQLEVVEPAVIGRNLDIDASIAYIDEQLKAGAHEVALQFERLEPDVTDDMTGEDLGITELLIQETSYFYGSDEARVQNIRTASAQFYGLLIAPGETFSMAAALGNVSLENGYAEALIIYGDQTIQGVGGGVCQVSTTLFRTAFLYGFPIDERHAHAYRVGYYEQLWNGIRDTNLAGLDATVYVPIVDLKFTNDTEYWLLMETYVGSYSLTWKFYSTKDGRTVEWETSGLTNVVEAPEPLYRENPDLAKGVIKQVDYAADGADISINRIVYMDDKVYFADSFYTHFQPWQAIFEYGPGTDIPETDDE